MTNERMVALLQSDREGFKEFLPILWRRTQKILFKMAREFYNKHQLSCNRRGVELCDIEGSCYGVFLGALDAFKPDKPTLFTTYFNHQFQIMTAELLNIRTERGRQEPLNRADSLDRQIEQGDGSSTTLLELIADRETSSFEDDVLETLNREQEAVIVRQAVAALPDLERRVIELYYFDNAGLSEIGEILQVSAERVRQIKRKALINLRRNRKLQLIYCENRQHQNAAWCSRFELSPQYYEIYRNLRERNLSYGQFQAELYQIQRRFDEEDNAAKSADG